MRLTGVLQGNVPILMEEYLTEMEKVLSFLTHHGKQTLLSNLNLDLQPFPVMISVPLLF